MAAPATSRPPQSSPSASRAPAAPATPVGSPCSHGDVRRDLEVVRGRRGAREEAPHDDSERASPWPTATESGRRAAPRWSSSHPAPSAPRPNSAIGTAIATARSRPSSVPTVRATQWRTLPSSASAAAIARWSVLRFETAHRPRRSPAAGRPRPPAPRPSHVVVQTRLDDLADRLQRPVADHPRAQSRRGQQPALEERAISWRASPDVVPPSGANQSSARPSGSSDATSSRVRLASGSASSAQATAEPRRVDLGAVGAVVHRVRSPASTSAAASSSASGSPAARSHIRSPARARRPTAARPRARIER